MHHESVGSSFPQTFSLYSHRILMIYRYLSLLSPSLLEYVVRDSSSWPTLTCRLTGWIFDLDWSSCSTLSRVNWFEILQSFYQSVIFCRYIEFWHSWGPHGSRAPWRKGHMDHVRPGVRAIWITCALTWGPHGSRAPWVEGHMDHVRLDVRAAFNV